MFCGGIKDVAALFNFPESFNKQHSGKCEQKDFNLWGITTKQKVKQKECFKWNTEILA